MKNLTYYLYTLLSLKDKEPFKVEVAMKGDLFKKRHDIKLADHGQTLLVEGDFNYLPDTIREMRKLNSLGKLRKVWIIKVKGFRVEPLRKSWDMKKFDELFGVQAEYAPTQKQFIIIRSNTPKLPIGVPLAFSGPPLPIIRG